MKRSPLERKSRLDRKRPAKRSQPKRDWTEANPKRAERCRFFGVPAGTYGANCEGPIELAHVIGREHDKHPAHIPYEDGLPNVTLAQPWPVAPDRVFPVCRRHHEMYDGHELDALPVLSVREQAQAVLDAGGIELARKRICGEAA